MFLHKSSAKMYKGQDESQISVLYCKSLLTKLCHPDSPAYMAWSLSQTQVYVTAW